MAESKTQTILPTITDKLAAWSHGEDERLTAARGDIAHIDLRGRIDTPRYVEGKVRRLFAHSAPLRAAPSPDATQISTLLFGEEFLVLDESEGWAWGQCLHDKYVGYLPASDLLEPLSAAPTHRIISSSHLYPRADIKSAPLMALPVGGTVTAINLEKAEDPGARFLKLPHIGFVIRSHLQPLDTRPGYLDIAKEFLGVPYLWGGRSHAGIDCSGLVQVALQCAGLIVPRDSDQQAEALGAGARTGSGQAGDLVFFPGHVGIMVDADNLLHANAHHMKTVIEPLNTLTERLSGSNAEPITGWVSGEAIRSLIKTQT